MLAQNKRMNKRKSNNNNSKIIKNNRNNSNSNNNKSIINRKNEIYKSYDVCIYLCSYIFDNNVHFYNKP